MLLFHLVYLYIYNLPHLFAYIYIYIYIPELENVDGLFAGDREVLGLDGFLDPAGENFELWTGSIRQLGAVAFRRHVDCRPNPR